MLLKHELISKIKDYFDLNAYETKVWLALLSKGIASAGEVAEISGVPRSRTYDVLESLEKRGFAIIKLSKPVQYLGIKPRMIIEKLKNNARKDAEDRIETLSKLKDTEEFVTLEEIYKNGGAPIKREDISASLRGKTNISNYLREMIQNAAKEVIVCTNVKELTSKSKLFQQTFSNLIRNNIKLRVALSGEEKLIRPLEEKLGIKIKKIKIDTKFFIIDRREILFYLSKNKDNEEIAIWLNSEFFSQAFASLFDKALEAK